MRKINHATNSSPAGMNNPARNQLLSNTKGGDGVGERLGMGVVLRCGVRLGGAVSLVRGVTREFLISASSVENRSLPGVRLGPLVCVIVGERVGLEVEFDRGLAVRVACPGGSRVLGTPG